MGMGMDPSTGVSTGNPNLAGAAGQYETPLPNFANAYLQNLTKSTMTDLPSFQEMYQSYKDLASQQSAQAGANINESLGSQGNRYSSDLLRMQGQNQRDLAADLRNAAAGYQFNLRGQQVNEIGNAASFLNNRDLMGQQFLWNDFLRRSGPPPLLGPAATQPGGAPSPLPF